MEEFYSALLTNGLTKIQNDKVKTIFDAQELCVKQLSNLTDKKFKEDGLIERGLREAVLSYCLYSLNYYLMWRNQEDLLITQADPRTL
jgi:hypothetical protein